ncbi:MAG: iron-siderophore ABC transporter substrate-binding protein [Acidimicrobiia bacterium]
MLVAITVSMLLAACGDSSSDDNGAAGSASAASEKGSDAFPVTIEQADGTVTIEEEPQRVVTLDFPSADAALALGVTPVGMASVSYIEGGVQEWTMAALDGEEPELFPTDDGYPFEAIARLEPDVILATNAYPLISENWDTLNEIAPVVGNVEGPGVDTWQQGLEFVGRALGRSDQAEQVIANVEAAIAQARESHPVFEGKTASFFNYAGGGLYVINSDDDFSMKFMRELGFAGVTDTVAAMPSTEGEGRADVSPEQYELIEADLVMGTSSDGDLSELEAQPTFARVPAVARGAFVPFDIGPATALAFPSALSLPYALDELVPQLADAMAGD